MTPRRQVARTIKVQRLDLMGVSVTAAQEILVLLDKVRILDPQRQCLTSVTAVVQAESWCGYGSQDLTMVGLGDSVVTAGEVVRDESRVSQ